MRREMDEVKSLSGYNARLADCALVGVGRPGLANSQLTEAEIKMGKQEDGGKSATLGFQAQALVVLLDGLERTDWTIVAIEPERENISDPSMQTVDIRWKKDENILRLDQVKYTKNKFTRGAVQKIAHTMNRDAHGEGIPRHLFLIGNLGEDITDDSTIENVTIHAKPPLQSLLDVAAHCIDKYFPGFPARAREAAVTSISGILMANAGTSKPWTRAELLREIEDQLRICRDRVLCEQTRAETAAGFSIHWDILVIASSTDERFDQIAVVTATYNPSAATNDSDQLTLYVSLDMTDTTWAGLDWWFDGKESNIDDNAALTRGTGQEKTNWQATITIPGPFTTGEQKIAGFRLSRLGQLDLHPGSIHYHDLFLHSNQSYRLTIVCPYDAEISTHNVSFKTYNLVELTTIYEGKVSVQISQTRKKLSKSQKTLSAQIRSLTINRFRLLIGQSAMDNCPRTLNATEKELKKLKDRFSKIGGLG